MAFIPEQIKHTVLADPTDSCTFCVPWPNDRIGVVIKAEELHGKNAALEKVEHGNARIFAKMRDELAGPARLGAHRT